MSMIGDSPKERKSCQGGEVEIFEENTTYYLDKVPKDIMERRRKHRNGFALLNLTSKTGIPVILRWESNI